MASPIGDLFKSFWHSMTSNDRHADFNSASKANRHMPVAQSRHAPLTSVTTSASDSHADLSDEGSKRPTITTQQVNSPSRPYSPGMRSMSSPKVAQVRDEEVANPGEIQMQSFDDGAPPPPPPSHSWKKIDRWAEANYEELYDNLCEGCTQNDINELEHELDTTLPQDVRESLSIHDGQERGGRPTGILLGCMLLDCEEIVQEWKQWKVVNEEYLSGIRKTGQPIYPIKSLNGASSSKSNQNNYSGDGKQWRQELLDKQASQPPKAIQKCYSHPSWIPMARDWGGNNIAVDLAPGPMGKWGQVILFGRDYDMKYVIAKSWAHFLSIVADDITSSKVLIDEESGEMKLKEFKTENVEPPYMEVLRWRADQKYGRRGSGAQDGHSKRRTGQMGINTSMQNGNGKSSSPYGSPTAESRGRSPHRFTSQSPRHTHAPPTGIGSPLARVQEEHSIMQPMPVRPMPEGDTAADFSSSIDTSGPKSSFESNRRKEKLVDVPTPTSASNQFEKREFPRSSLSRVSTLDPDLDTHSETNTNTSMNPESIYRGTNTDATTTNSHVTMASPPLQPEVADIATSPVKTNGIEKRASGLGVNGIGMDKVEGELKTVEI